jgi:hypothetical protein
MRVSILPLSKHTGVGVGNIVGAVTERGKNECDRSYRKDPVIFSSDCGRHSKYERQRLKRESFEYLLRRLSTITGRSSIYI